NVDRSTLESGTATKTQLLEPAPENAGAREAAAFVMVILFFLTALGFGMTIAQSVTQEKESRVVEILAAAVPIRALLWGKIAGNTVLALGQVLLMVAAAIVSAAFAGQGNLLADLGPALAWYVVFFVLGFGALSTLWAVAGALASRQQDLTSTTLPAQMLLMIPYFLSFAGGDAVREVVSMIPIVSTIIMPGRMAEGSVPAWQIGVAIGGTLVAAVLLVRLGTAIYERALLRTGQKLGYREALSIEGT
ncbi:MAG: ABC transporter permease, partial [Actinomycetales bacterium]